LRNISRDSTDEDFRRQAAQLIDSARDEILVITGEISAYGFADLKWAAERARDRGVSIKVYASDPSPEISNSLTARGVEVFLGPREKDHYLVVDSKSYILSNPHGPGPGARSGQLHRNEPEKAAKIKRRFEQLVAKAKPVRKIDWRQDSLRRALDKPFDWKVDTHASRLDEEFA
jgi:sugar-specific transcriptional regulator TrmB